jgi:putative flippase GtrA
VKRLDTAGQLMRFVGVGAINSLLTGGLFLVLSEVVAPAVAYTIAFLIGVGFAVVVTPRVVFDHRPSSLLRAAYGAWYLLLYLVGLAVVYFVHDVLGQDRFVIVAVTIPTSAALSFVGARFLFQPRGLDAR